MNTTKPKSKYALKFARRKSAPRVYSDILKHPKTGELVGPNFGLSTETKGNPFPVLAQAWRMPLSSELKSI